MDAKQQPHKLTGKDIEHSRRTPTDQADLLPWADPYIAHLLREHERQTRQSKGARTI